MLCFEEKKQISKSGAERLALEIVRQAVYDWSNPEYQEEVKSFFCSEWGEELVDVHKHSPKQALARLESRAIDPRDFYAGAGPSLDKYVSTKNSRPACPLFVDQWSS
jgi:hypothetical protein